MKLYIYTHMYICICTCLFIYYICIFGGKKELGSSLVDGGFPGTLPPLGETPRQGAGHLSHVQTPYTALYMYTCI